MSYDEVKYLLDDIWTPKEAHLVEKDNMFPQSN